MRAILLKVKDPISYTVTADRQKAIGLLSKITSFHVHHAFLYTKKGGKTPKLCMH